MTKKRPDLGPPIPYRDMGPYNYLYLVGCKTPSDPTIVFGTEVSMQTAEEGIAASRGAGPVPVTPLHLLLKATAAALDDAPELSARIVGGHVRRDLSRHALVPVRDQRRNCTRMVTIFDVDQKTLPQLAQETWEQLIAVNREDARDDGLHLPIPSRPFFLAKVLHRVVMRSYIFLTNRFGLAGRKRHRDLTAPSVLVNYLGSADLPPLRAFKPSRFPTESCPLSVTMGAARPEAVVADGEVVTRPMAPLFVRADHRIADLFEIGRFAGLVKAQLESELPT